MKIMEWKGFLEKTQDKNSKIVKEAIKSIKEGLQIGTLNDTLFFR